MTEYRLSESQIIYEQKQSAQDENPENSGSAIVVDKRDQSFYKARRLKTIVLLVMLILSGISGSALGPTFVDLELYFNCSTKMMSIASPLQSCGVFAASIIVMLGLNPLSTEMSTGLSMIFVAVLTSAWAAVPSIYWFLVLGGLRGFFSCINMSGCQPYCLQLWENHRLQKPVLHSIHAVISLGVAIGPFIITPILSSTNQHLELAPDASMAPEKDYNFSLSPAIDNGSLEDVTNYYENSFGQTSSTTSVWQEYGGNVKYVFLAIGIPLLFPSSLFTAVCLLTGVPILRAKKETVKNNSNKSKKQKKLPEISRLDRNLLVTLTFLLYFGNAITEFVPSTYFTLYVTTVLNWKMPQRTLINSAFHSALTIGRILGIPLSGYFKQRTILAANVCVVLMAAILLILARYNDVMMWLSAALLGFGISTLYGGTLLWLSESIRVNGRMVSAIMISFSTGAMLGPLITGQLFDSVSPMCMTYVILAAAILDLSAYLGLRVLESRRFKLAKQLEESVAMNEKI